MLTPYKRYSLIALLLFVVLYPTGFFVLSFPAYPLWILTWSLITLLLFGYDKLQAQSGSPRIPEYVLYGLILLGGYLGALLGMSLFKHKKRKSWFWILTWLSFVGHSYIMFRFYPYLFSFLSLGKLN